MLASARFVIKDHILSFFDKFLGPLLKFVLSADSTQQDFDTESTRLVVTEDDLLGPYYYRSYLVSSLILHNALEPLQASHHHCFCIQV